MLGNSGKYLKKGMKKRQERRENKLNAKDAEDRGIERSKGEKASDTKDAEEICTMCEEEEDAFVDAVETCSVSISDPVPGVERTDAKKYMVELSKGSEKKNLACCNNYKMEGLLVRAKTSIRHGEEIKFSYDEGSVLNYLF